MTRSSRRSAVVLPAVLLLSATLATSPACAASRSRVYVRGGPPAPIVDTRIVAPGPGYVWIPGYHRWSGSAYVWVPGRWDRPPRAQLRWAPGHWAHDRRGWYFVEGHWR
jgi:YXWGXW repeat-containing protein